MKKKIKQLIFPTIYLGLVIVICFVFLNAFKRNHYSVIYVDGSSMAPTLNNPEEHPELPGYVDFGKIDSHKKAIDNIKRFDIITTYYPWSDYASDGELKDGASYKIKRVIGLPFETISIDNSVMYEETITIIDIKGKTTVYADEEDSEKDYVALPFTRNRATDRYRGGACLNITLGEDEYFVVGDNWASPGGSSSDDCLNHNHPIYKKNITGVLVVIEGVAKPYTQYTHHMICDACGHKFDIVNESSEEPSVSCPKCGGTASQISCDDEDLIKDLHYFTPKYFL